MSNLNKVSDTILSKNSFISTIKNNKYPMIITIGFFLASSYVIFYHHHFWFEYDGIVFLNWGNDVLEGNAKNIFSSGAPMGGPVLFAYLDSFIGDGFLTIKLISLLTGAGCLFFSYYIIQNIFNQKIAIVSQLFFATQASFFYQTILSEDTLLSVFLILISLYFITKNNLHLKHIIFTSVFLGLSFMVRYQALFIFIAIVLFLLIRDYQIKKNLQYVCIFFLVFVFTISPLLMFNHDMYGRFIDSSPSFYIIDSKYQTPEWNEKIEQIFLGKSNDQIFSIDFNLFLQNYFYYLFYNNTSNFFNFNSVDNSSIIPPIPFLGMIPVFGGLVYLLREKLKKKDVIIACGIGLVTAFFVVLLGDIQIHFFAIIIIPLLSVCILNIKNFEKNLLPILISSLIFPLLISFMPVSRTHMFSIWIVIPMLSVVFFIEAIPKIINYTKRKFSSNDHLSIKIPLIIIIIVLFVNVGFTFKILEATLYNEPYLGIQNEISKFSNMDKHVWEENGKKYYEIGNILSKQPNIENSYIIANHNAYAYYANSKFTFTYFTEGLENDTLDMFVKRTNWSDVERKISYANTNPAGNPEPPLYLIYEKPLGQPDRWGIIENPKNPAIPNNFELLYYSNRTNAIVYKINYSYNDVS